MKMSSSSIALENNEETLSSSKRTSATATMNIGTTVKLATQRFFEISPIHGCSYVGFRSAIYEGVIWSIALIFCTILCVNDIVSLTNQFNSQLTAVEVIMERNQTLSFPQAAVCFDIFRANIGNAINGTFNEEAFNGSVAKFASLIAATSDLSMLPIQDPDIDIVMKTTYLLLMAIVDYDLGIPGQAFVPNAILTGRAVDLVEAFFTEVGYTYDQLYEQTARFWCKQAVGISSCSSLTDCTECTIIDLGAYTSSCLDICGTANITWFGLTLGIVSNDDVCFALNTPLSKVFASPEDQFGYGPIYLSHLSNLVADWNQTTASQAYYGSPKMIFDMRGWEGVVDPRQMDSLAMVAEGTSVMLGVQIFSQFIADNRSGYVCGQYSPTHCGLFDCLTAARIAADSCWPLAGYTTTQVQRPDSVPVCGRRFTNGEISKISNLGKTGMYTSTWETCIFEQCSTPQCNIVQYEYLTALSSLGDGVTVTLFQGKMIYSMLLEYVIMDFSSYLATFGGIIGERENHRVFSKMSSVDKFRFLGLWLGGSLISIVHLPVFIACTIINNVRERRRAQLQEIPAEDSGAAAAVRRKEAVAAVTTGGGAASLEPPQNMCSEYL